jgi:hypothetical protein
MWQVELCHEVGFVSCLKKITIQTNEYEGRYRASVGRTSGVPMSIAVLEASELALMASGDGLGSLSAASGSCVVNLDVHWLRIRFCHSQFYL